MSDGTDQDGESMAPVSSVPGSPVPISTDDGQELASSELFAPNYALSRPTTSALPDLPEDAEVSEFRQPQVDIVLQEIAPDAPEVNKSDPLQDTASLMPSAASSPNMRRRSSTAGHRRRPSGQSNGSISSPNMHRRRSSVASSGSKNDFDEFQEGDNDGSDFGDFDDFVEGEFDDGEVFSEEEAVPTTSQYTDEASIDLPDVTDADAVQQYVHAAINSLFGIVPAVPTIEAPALATAEADTTTTEDESTRPQQKEAQQEEDEEEEESPFMLTDRAISLWRQLTAPPPLQPPDWKRSRIRRLFLVSLGIPVDLDEILPKMTHKKLVLPSTRKHREKRSNDERRSRKKIPPPPEFEILGARQLCSTTRMALNSMTEHELAIHIATLRAHTTTASGLLQYWLEQRDAAQSEKETFEQVIHNLVQYHKKQKDEQKEASNNAKKSGRSRFSMMRS